MKKHLLSLSILVTIVFMLQGCVKDSLTTTYTYFLPVYKSKAEVLKSIKSSPPQALKQTGKLVLYGDYILVNELNKGVHIIDNSNPATPKNTAFISIPGNIDIAVKNGTLYADLFADMVTLDISDPSNVVLKKLTPNVFPERTYEVGLQPDTTKYIVDWIKKETVDKTGVERTRENGQPILWLSASEAMNAGGATKAVIGVSGSMARFTIVNNYLYTVGRASLTAFNITATADPLVENTRQLGWNIETIYPLKDKLFIGSQTGMFIYDISNPEDPSFLSNFSHACFNDPVIADDQYAYVTLRAATGTSCMGVPTQRNELDIVNISNLLQPTLVKIYDMTEPMGLSKDGDFLFICDGKGGLKIYNASDVQNLDLINTIENINPFDIICQGGNAVVVADEGIYQYDYSNINNVRLISKIETDKKGGL